MSRRPNHPPASARVPALVGRYVEYATALAAAEIASPGLFRSNLEIESYDLKAEITHAIVGDVDTGEAAAMRDEVHTYLGAITDTARTLMHYDVRLIALRHAGKARTGTDRNRTAATAKGARETRNEQINQQADAVRSLLTMDEAMRANQWETTL